MDALAGGDVRRVGAAAHPGLDDRVADLQQVAERGPEGRVPGRISPQQGRLTGRPPVDRASPQVRNETT